MHNFTSFTVADWVRVIQTLHHREIELGLDRLLPVANRLQVRQFSCPVVTVTGSNGKGTTVGFLNEVYLQSGYRVGMYTSPHLIDFNERIQVNALAISDVALCDAFCVVERNRQNIPLTFFEFTTLAALYYFKQQNCDVLLLEVGMGGRLDAVNCVEPDLSIITSISLEHQQWLGATRDAIAREKCGIMRPGVPLICGDFSPPTVIAERVHELDCPSYFIQKDYGYSSKGTHLDWRSNEQQMTGLPCPAIPRQNAATALMAISCLQARLPVHPDAIARACSTVEVPGRLQFFTHPHPIVLDVAHNPAASSYVASQLPERYPCRGKRWCLFSLLKDKDILNTLKPWITLIDHWVIVPIANERAAIVTDLVATVEQLTQQPAVTKESIEAGYQWICQHVAPEDHIIVFGSFYLVGEVMKYCKKYETLC